MYSTIIKHLMVLLMTAAVNAGRITDKLKDKYTAAKQDIAAWKQCESQTNDKDAVSKAICVGDALVSNKAPVMTWPTHMASQDDLSEIKYYLPYAGASYCEPEAINNWKFDLTNNTDFKSLLTDIDVHVDEKYQLIAYSGYNKQRNEIIVTFRGTVTTLNWIDDGEMKKNTLTTSPNVVAAFEAGAPSSAREASTQRWPAPPVDATVHHGFKTLMDSLLPGIATSYARLVNKYEKAARTVVAGHSLGAAMATLASVELAILNPTATFHVALYGSPRVGTPAWVRWYHSIIPVGQVYRADNLYDPVPWTPLAQSGFLAVGQEYFMAPKNKNAPYTTAYETTDMITYKCAVTALPGIEDPHCTMRSRHFVRQSHSYYFGADIHAFCTAAKVKGSLKTALRDRL